MFTHWQLLIRGGLLVAGFAGGLAFDALYLNKQRHSKDLAAKQDNEVPEHGPAAMAPTDDEELIKGRLRGGPLR